MVGEMERGADEPVRTCLRFSRQELEALLLEAGLTAIEMETAETFYLVAVGHKPNPAKEASP